MVNILTNMTNETILDPKRDFNNNSGENEQDDYKK
jgi:hypothetical protein